jgi:hypothetical protein
MIRNLVQSSLIVLFIGLAGPTAMASDAKEAAALRAARSWLSLVDAGNYEASWRSAARYFKSAVTQEQWRQAMTGVRQPLGRVLSRDLKGKTYATSLPGAPDGQYVVIQFNTSFQKKRAAVETITPMLEADGRWSVAGYFIK